MMLEGEITGNSSSRRDDRGCEDRRCPHGTVPLNDYKPGGARPQRRASAKGRGAPVPNEEISRLSIALQVFNSVINNQMMNNPGPLTLNSEAFLPTLLRVFQAVYAAPLG